MNDDDHVCLCFHVSKRKVIQFIRATRPSRTSQLSECYGAGTGCGWCRPFLQRLMDANNPADVDLPSSDQYASNRQDYRREKDERDPLS